MTSSSRSVRIYVHDPAGLPVPGAVVEVVQFCQGPIPPSITTAEGIATLNLPADVGELNVLALKPGVGLDYFEVYRSWPPHREMPALAPEVHLVLDGAREVTVQAVDSAGRPMPNVPLTPWTVKKKGKLAYVNCSESRATTVRTDAEGFARFSWIPTGLEGVTQFLVQDGQYHCSRTPWIDLAHPDRPLTARLLRNTRVAGRVLLPDGGPAVGISVRAEGRGRTNHYCRQETKCGPDGSYEFLLYPEQSYIIAVLDEAWAARSLRGVITHEGQPRTCLDLRLIRGTRLQGRVTLGPERQPAPGQTVTLVEQGDELDENLRCHFKQEALVRWAKTDGSGYYGFRVGPGRYQLRGPEPVPPEDLVVEVVEAIALDFHLPHLSRGLLAGTVRRSGQKRESVAHAVVRGESSIRGHAGFETVADGQGGFSSERWRERMLVYARDPEGAEAGCSEIGEQEEAVTVQVSPAGTARGRVVDHEGSPRSNENVFCRMELPLEDGTSVTFQIEVRTDIMGDYIIAGLVVGSSCDVTVLRGYEPVAPRVPFPVLGPGVLELPNLMLEQTAP